MPRSRYTTGLPSIAALAQNETQDVNLSQVENFVALRESEVTPQVKKEPIRIHNVHSSHDTPRYASVSHHKKAAATTDSSLPYLRPARGNDARDVAARMILVGEDSNSSSDRISSPTFHSSPESSNSSNSRSYELDTPRRVRVQPSPTFTPETSPEMSKDRYNINDRNASPPQTHSSTSPKESRSSSETTNTIVHPSTPKLPQRNPKRAESPSLVVPRSSSEVSSQPITPTDPSSQRSRRHRISGLKALIPSPLPFVKGRRLSRGRFVMPEPESKPPPDVEYENVEGVKLDTQPAAIPEKQTGLSLPEIEARDIRQIPNPDDESRNSIDSTNRERFFAGSPLTAGANRRINSRTTSPRESSEAYTYAVVEDNSQVYICDIPEQLPMSPQIASHNNDASVDQGRAMRMPQIARHSSARGSFDAPATIPEDSREDVLDIADEKNEYEDPAEPPPIAMSKDFEERDSRMTRAVQTAKSLISKML